MVAERQEAQKSYQRALRIIGRYLDSQPSYDLSIVQTADGFTVRAHSSPGRADEHVKHFAWDRLATEDQYYGAAARGAGPRRRVVESWPFPCRHEQALRKLGSILDEEQASDLSVQETENGLEVVYARTGGTAEKQQRVVDPAELCGDS